MPLQDDLAAFVDGCLNRRHVQIWVTRSDHDGLRRCGCPPRQDDRESCDESPREFSICLTPLRYGDRNSPAQEWTNNACGKVFSCHFSLPELSAASGDKD